MNECIVVRSSGVAGPPTLTSATVEDASANTVDLVFSEAVTITTAGWSIATDGTSLSILSLTGSGTSTPYFTLSRSVLSTETITLSYDSSIGDTVNGNHIELADIVNRAVTNNVAAPHPFLTLSGTILDNTSELDIVNGGKTLIFTLSGGTFDGTIGGDNSKTIDLINSISANVFDTVKSGITYSDVVKNSSTIVTITLPALPGYKLVETEKLNISIPQSVIPVAEVNVVNWQQPKIYSEIDLNSLYRFNFGTSLRMVDASFIRVLDGNKPTQHYNYSDLEQDIFASNPAGSNVLDETNKWIKNTNGQVHASLANNAGVTNKLITGDFHVFVKYRYDIAGQNMAVFSTNESTAATISFANYNGVSDRTEIYIDGGPQQTVTGINLIDGTDYILEVVRNGTEIKFYIDGVLKATETHTAADVNLGQVGYSSFRNYSSLYYWSVLDEAKSVAQATRIREIINEVT